MKYKSQGKQLTFEAFRSSLDNLPKSNRWIRMGDELPWDDTFIWGMAGENLDYGDMDTCAVTDLK